jgi:hypothetical protein
MGKAGLSGVHTILKPGPDEGFLWPIAIDAPHKQFPRRRWDDDQDEEPFPQGRYDFKEYEFKLLAALAQCYRGQKTFADLPMIPVEMADLIIRQGGLQAWLQRSEHRLARFRKIAEDQEKGTKLLPKSAVRRRRQRQR